MSVLLTSLFSALRDLSGCLLNASIDELMDTSILKDSRLILSFIAFLRFLVYEQELAMGFKMSKLNIVSRYLMSNLKNVQEGRSVFSAYIS